MTSLILLALTAVFAAVAPGLFGAALINIAGFFIGIAGMLLDLALRYLVVDFAKYIYSPVADAIGNTLWAAFRDISNILIIGMFTLIAVSIIIGAQSFNAKRMVAQVLIVAVLINFSLLFTRIIIEASNFVAGKFYSAMALDSSVNAASASASAGSFEELINFASQSGISGQFINLLGLPSAFDARDTVNSVWSGNASYAGRLSGISASGGIAAIIYAFTTTALLLCTSIVLMYAVLLLIARTALLLFLLVTSSLAFGAHLIPKWGDKYWSMWWNALLKNALFAPLLMLMLWTTMTLSYALVKGAGVRSFDKLFSDPTNGSGALALLIFFLILAMLYGSIRFAGSFANSIAGYSELKLGLGASLALGARGFGFAGRQTLGRLDALAARQNTAKAQALAAEIAEAKRKGETSRIPLLQKKYEDARAAARGANEASRRTYNLAETDRFKGVVKKLGAQSLLGGKTKSVVEKREEVAKDAAKKAREGALSKDSVETLIRENRKSQQDNLQRQHDDATKLLEAVRKGADGQIDAEGLRTEHEKALQDARKAEQEATANKIRHQNDTTISETERKSRMNAEDEKIAQANARVRTYQQRIDAINNDVKAAENAQKTTFKALEDFEKEIKSTVSNATEADIKAQKNEAAKAVSTLGRGLTAEMARSEVKKQAAKDEKEGGIFAAIKKQMDASNKGSDKSGEKSK